MKKVLPSICLLTKKILLILILFLAMTGQAYNQCLPGSSVANVNWDNLDYLVTTGNYSGYVTTAMSRTQGFAFGVNRVVINYASTITTSGENTTHTGEANSYGTGADVQYGGNGLITFTFDAEVNNFRFSVYDIDASQRVNVTAVNAGGTSLPISMTKPAGGTVTITGSGTFNAQGQGPAGAAANNVTVGTVNLSIVGPVKTVSITLSGTAGDFWISDLLGCVTGTFPTNYFVASRPFTGQPTYVIGTSDTNTVSLINTSNGQAKMIFQDATSPRYINGIAYDHLEHNLYYVVDFTANPQINKTIKRFNFDTETMSVLVPNVNTLGIPTFQRGVESAGCAFYDSCLYFGIEGNLSPGNNGGRETIIWRIAFDAPGGNAVSACQVYATPADNGSGTVLHDWNDFTIADGLLVDFAGAPTASARRFTHYDLQTQNIVQNYYTGSLTPRQAGITWDDTRYWVYDRIAVYNMDGTIGPQTTITGATVLDWTGFCGDATGFRPKSDFGDAPPSYDPVALSPALHEKDTALRLGPTWDQEFNKTSSSMADADGSDEDAIATVHLLDTATTNYTAQVTIYNNTGGNVTLGGWLDINGNGTFESSEGRTLVVPHGGPVLQTRTLSWLGINTPLNAGQMTFLRIRVARSGLTVNSATGYFNNGEVEDYPVYVIWMLPVTLLSFDAIVTDNKTVKINWSATGESQLDNYEVQRSVDAANWTTIGSVSARNEAGVQNYSMIDESPAKGRSYYRLRINGTGGSAKYSTTKTVYIDRGAMEFQVMPNPAREQMTVQVFAENNCHLLLQFYDASGRMVHQIEKDVSAGENKIPVSNLSQWSPGIYFLTVFEGQERIFSKRIVVSRN